MDQALEINTSYFMVLFDKYRSNEICNTSSHEIFHNKTLISKMKINPKFDRDPFGGFCDE